MKLVVQVTASLVLLGVATFFVMLGAADVLAYRADVRVSDWSPESLPDVERWEDTLHLANRAHRLAPLDASYQTLRGRILQWGAIAFDSHDDASLYRARAMASHQQALKLRPTWPYLYANLAAAKAQIGQFDAQFTRALQQSVVLGPWEPRIHQLIVDLGATHWEQLNNEQRQWVRTTVQRSLSVNSGRTFSWLESAGRLDWICQDPPDEYLQQRCERSAT